MLLTLRFPVIDLRSFCRTDYPRSVRLPATWTEELDFVRYFGPVTRRLQGPVDPWTAERSFCRFDRAVRLHPSYPALLSRRVPGFRFFGIKRRLYPATTGNDLFYADLQLIAHSRRGPAPGPDLTGMVREVLGMPATVRTPANDVIESPVGRLGSPIVRAFDAATTVGHPSGLIHAGAPAVVVELADDELPEPSRLRWQIHTGLVLGATTVDTGAGRVNVFLVRRPGRSDRHRARTLRVHLLRLHAEREHLRRMARLLAGEGFLAGCSHAQVERVQQALNQSLRVLTRSRSHGFLTAEIATAFLADRVIAGSELETLMERVRSFRPVIRNRLQRLQEQEAATAARGRQLAAEPQPRNLTYIVIQESRVSTYDQRNSQIGAAGDHASAANPTFGPQLNLAATSPADRADLQAAIQALRTHLADRLLADAVIDVDGERVSAVQIGSAIGSLSEAEEAIAAADESRVRGALQKSGRWLASFADRVGVELAATAIRAALGLS